MLHARAMQNVLQVHAEFCKYEEREQIDSGDGGVLSQAAGHDGSFYGYDVYLSKNEQFSSQYYNCFSQARQQINLP